MTARLRLEVVLRIPIGVKNYYGVRSSQVDPQTAGTSAQQKDKSLWLLLGKAVNSRLAEISTNISINSLKWIAKKSTLKTKT